MAWTQNSPFDTSDSVLLPRPLTVQLLVDRGVEVGLHVNCYDPDLSRSRVRVQVSRSSGGIGILPGQRYPFPRTVLVDVLNTLGHVFLLRTGKQVFHSESSTTGVSQFGLFPGTSELRSEVPPFTALFPLERNPGYSLGRYGPR